MIVVNYALYCLAVGVVSGAIYFLWDFVSDMQKQRRAAEKEADDLRHVLNETEEQLNVMRVVLKEVYAERDQLTESVNKLLKEQEEAEVSINNLNCEKERNRKYLVQIEDLFRRICVG